MKSFGVVFLLLWSAGSASADEWDREGSSLKSSCGSLTDGFAAIASCGQFFFDSGKPLRLMIPTSVVPGGGTELGPLFIQPLDIHNWPESNLNIDGGSSLRGFWFGNATVTLNHRKFGGEWNTARDEFRIQIYGKARGLPVMPFYGIGPNTAKSSLVDYRERDVREGASVFMPLQSWFAAGGSAEFLSTQIGRESNPSVRSINTYYTEATAPGLGQTANFGHFQIYARPKKDWRWTTVDSDVTFDYYKDGGSGLFTSRKFRVDYLQKIYLGWQKEPNGGVGANGHRKQPKYDSVLYIAARFTDASAGAGSVVPFYLQETLGGSDIDNVPTLCGFADYRFRAPALFSIQTQYERRLLPDTKPGAQTSTLRRAVGAIGVLAFFDAGEVAAKASNLSFGNMRQSFGFGFSLWAGNKVWFRTYIGLGSGEGSHLFLGISDPSAQSPHL